MELPTPPHAVLALAAFVRERLADVSETLTPLWKRSESELARLSGEQRVVAATARQFATVITGAAAPFAPTSYARARLIRQMHASGLLSDSEARRTEALLADAGSGASELRDSQLAGSWLAATGTESRGVPRRAPRPWR